MDGIYIHIPFCKSKCPYCDFHSGKYNKTMQTEYINALIEEINTLKRYGEFYNSKTAEADTLYLGGGTPSVLKGEEIEKIVLAAKNGFNLRQNSEITIECNPGSPIEELIPYFKNCGINRISLGLQSAIDTERRILGRISDKTRVKEVISLLQNSGFENISLDVMLGIPEQTIDSLKETLDFIIECNVPHISAYILKIEKGTFFDTHRERYSFPDDDTCADLYEFCCDYLEHRGFVHYEISNFSKPGFESKHNTKYWILENYLGIGPAAHSFINGKRFYFPADTEGFINGEKPVFDGYGGDAKEYIMLHLRLKEGLNLKKLRGLYSDFDISAIKNKLPLLRKQELIIYENEIVSLTAKGMLLSNYVINEFI